MCPFYSINDYRQELNELDQYLNSLNELASAVIPSPSERLLRLMKQSRFALAKAVCVPGFPEEIRKSLLKIVLDESYEDNLRFIRTYPDTLIALVQQSRFRIKIDTIEQLEELLAISPQATLAVFQQLNLLNVIVDSNTLDIAAFILKHAKISPNILPLVLKNEGLIGRITRHQDIHRLIKFAIRHDPKIDLSLCVKIWLEKNPHNVTRLFQTELQAMQLIPNFYHLLVYLPYLSQSALTQLFSYPKIRGLISGWPLIQIIELRPDSAMMLMNYSDLRDTLHDINQIDRIVASAPETKNIFQSDKRIVALTSMISRIKNRFQKKETIKPLNLDMQYFLKNLRLSRFEFDLLDQINLHSLFDPNRQIQSPIAQLDSEALGRAAFTDPSNLVPVLNYAYRMNEGVGMAHLLASARNFDELTLFLQHVSLPNNATEVHKLLDTLEKLPGQMAHYIRGQILLGDHTQVPQLGELIDYIEAVLQSNDNEEFNQHDCMIRLTDRDHQRIQLGCQALFFAAKDSDLQIPMYQTTLMNFEACATSNYLPPSIKAYCAFYIACLTGSKILPILAESYAQFLKQPQEMTCVVRLPRTLSL